MSLPREQAFPEWTRALSTIAWSFAFWSTLLYEMLKTQLTQAIPTLGVGGGVLYVNKDYFCDPKFNDANRVFMIAHELSHEMLFHPHYMAEYAHSGIDGEPLDQQRLNCAADYIVNDMLVRFGIGEYHKDWLLSPHFTWEDNLFDVYRRLKPKNPPPPQGGGDGQGESGQGEDQQGEEQNPTGGAGEGNQSQQAQYDILDKEGNVVGETPAGQQQFDEHKFDEPSPHSMEDWKQAVAGAHQVAKEMGQGSTAMDRFVNDYLESKRDWRRELWDYVTPHRGRDLRNYKRIHKRKLYERRIPVPTRHSHKLGVIAMIHDVSGSVSMAEHQLCRGAAVGILSQLPPKELRVMSVADMVITDDIIEVDEYAEWQPKGGGGTDMEAAFRKMLDEGYIPDLCIVLTDGYTAFTTPPPFPVVWLSTSLPVDEFKYGHAIRLEDTP